MNPLMWLILFIILLVIEILTLGLTTIWFAGGALAACVAAFLGTGPGVQVILFLVISVVLLVLTRPIAIKHFNSNREKTNVESMVGRTGVVLEEIDTVRTTGRVEVGGMEWSAKTAESDGMLAKDSIVEVTGIEGVKLVVKKKEEA
ncbi:MAG TPA: NfeD family protein [Lachnospiraceae bacterium]|nr:NfeD family protein [Lachnospiraceae bacterium]